MTQRDPEFGAELEPAQVARLTGLTLDDLDPSYPSAGGFHWDGVCDRGAAEVRGAGAAESEAGGGHGVAARARRALVLCAGAEP